jgi:hypothetical protein
MRALLFCGLSFALLMGCANTDAPLRSLTAAGAGPDAFSAIPLRPLVMPDAGAPLVAPTPGGTNRADPDPRGDAIIALGGNRAAGVAGDSALFAQVARYGVDPDIRAQLAAADTALLDRRNRTNLFNPLNRDRYFPAYASQALDAQAELARLRAAGIKTPTPPAPN